MFSTALIIFREIIEIALIVGIVLAATKDLPGRMKWIVGGFVGGIAGAGLVAVFAGAISDAAQGMGQELFNACILFAAAIVIGWTVLWVKGHAKEMALHFKQVGHDIRDGKLPFYSLSVVIGLALLREGSEIVLFIYSMTLSGQSASSIAIGSIIGLFGGIVVGTLFYYGLLRISTKYMLTVTSWLLMILVAGLTAQGVGYLTAAGYLNSFTKQVWDSSWLLSESSIFGKALHSLIGYTSRPTEIQLAAYLAVLAFLLIGGWMIDRKKHAPKAVVAAFIFMALSPLHAQAIDKIYDPYVNKGEAEVEFNGNQTFDHNRDKDAAREYEIELGYSPTDYWEIEVSNGFERSTGSPTVQSDIEIENKFALTEPGEYFLDVGALVAYAKAFHKDDADTLETKLLVQKDIGKFSSLMNIGFEQGLGSENHGGPDFALAWNNRYRFNEFLQPGVEFQADFGQTNLHQALNQDEIYLGPSVYGKIYGRLGYQAVYLVGLNSSSAQRAGRLMLEYESHF